MFQNKYWSSGEKKMPNDLDRSFGLQNKMWLFISYAFNFHEKRKFSKFDVEITSQSRSQENRIYIAEWLENPKVLCRMFFFRRFVLLQIKKQESIFFIVVFRSLKQRLSLGFGSLDDTLSFSVNRKIKREETIIYRMFS